MLFASHSCVKITDSLNLWFPCNGHCSCSVVPWFRVRTLKRPQRIVNLPQARIFKSWNSFWYYDISSAGHFSLKDRQFLASAEPLWESCSSHCITWITYELPGISLSTAGATLTPSREVVNTQWYNTTCLHDANLWEKRSFHPGELARPGF